jgi:uncharacterized protein (DUF1800 family)
MSDLTRRQFLEEVIATQTAKELHKSVKEDTVFKKYANQTLPAVRKTSSTLSEYTGTWSETQVRHLLRRTMFGVRGDDVNTLLGMSMSDAVDYLLNNIPPAPNPPLNNYTPHGSIDITGVPAGQTWVTAPIGDGSLNDTRRYSYKAWWYGVMINQNLSIQEKIVFFWHNHFATQTYVVGYAVLSYDHNVLLRSNALGNFKQLVSLVTKDPAMLIYLGGYLNTKNNPDENYGRELQELFTVGKFAMPNYTEDDVKAASRVLTGWRVNLLSNTSFFEAQEHEITDKQFSSFYNNTIISGVAGSAGASETDELINMIFTKSEVAQYLCTKLYRFFVYYNIDATIDATIIQPLAQIFIDNNYEIKPVLQALLKSAHFYDANNMGCYIKTPLDFLVGTMRTFDIAFPAGINVSDTYALWNYLANYGAKIGLDLGDPPNVAGWEPFYESPAFYEIWINSSTFPLRMEFTDMMASAGFSAGTATNIAIDILTITKANSNASDPDLLVDYFAASLLGVAISDTEHNNLKSILLSGQVSNNYWTEAWSNYIANPDDINTSIVSTRLYALLTTMLRLPEHQLC